MGRGPLETPVKSAIREAIFRRRSNESKNDIFRQFGISKKTGYRILREPPKRMSRRLGNSIFPETRGRPKILSEFDVTEIVYFIENNGYDGRTIPYTALPAAAGIEKECSGETVRLALKTWGFRFCKACQKKALSDKAKERRVEYAETMLRRYPDNEDWRHIRFSDETHFG